ncbi:MAG: hypothetical protein ACFHHU_06100 [Porticoccaceae bacterium]
MLRNDSGLEIRSVQVRVTDIRSGASRVYPVGGRVAAGNQAATGTGIIGDPANFRIAVVAAELN